MVENGSREVNRKRLSLSQLRLIFALSSPMHQVGPWSDPGPTLVGPWSDLAKGRACYHPAFSRMLRAALIGFGSSGKTTLFQLMTSAVGTARTASGKGESLVGISKVP